MEYGQRVLEVCACRESMIPDGSRDGKLGEESGEKRKGLWSVGRAREEVQVQGQGAREDSWRSGARERSRGAHTDNQTHIVRYSIEV